MLPTKNQKFQDYYAPALETKSIWRLLAGMIVLTVVYIVFGILVRFWFEAYLDITGGSLPYDGGMEAVIGGGTPVGVIVVLMSFVGMFLGVYAAVKLVHKRRLKTLFGPNFQDVLRGFGKGFIFLTAVSLISLALYSFIDPPNKNMELPIWLYWMIFAIPLLFLQILSEELVFRGYLQQQLAARFNSRWVWYVLPSVLFGVLHFDQETLGPNAWLVVVQTTLFGLIAADITARTGTLGAAIGLHFANNLFAMTVVSLDGTILSGLGLYTTAVHASDVQALRSIIILDIVFFLALYGGYMLWWKNRSQL